MKKKSKTWERTKTQYLLRHQKSGKFYGRWKVGGKQIWRALKTDVYEVAEKRLNEETGKILGLRQNSKSRQRVEAGSAYMVDLIEEYKRRILLNADLKESSKESRLVALKKLLKTWPELGDPELKLKPSQIGHDAVVEWANRFKNEGTGFVPPGAKTAIKGNSATSVNRAIDTLRRLMDIAIERGAIHTNPVAIKPAEGRLKKKVTRTRIEIPSAVNLQRLFVAIESNGAVGGWGIEAADFCRFLAFSGCRVGEVSTVTWASVDWDRKQLRVRGYKTETSDRTIPLFPELEALLKKVTERRKKAALYSQDGKPMVEAKDPLFRLKECQKSIDRACEKLGIARITHHDFRHAFATACIEAGVDIPTVAGWLGHSDGGALAMKVYGHLRQEHSQAAAQKVRFS